MIFFSFFFSGTVEKEINHIFPAVNLTAKCVRTGQTVSCFEDYVEIIFSSETGAFDNVVLDVEHSSSRKYLVPQRAELGRGIFHTYFTRRENEIKISTKHFSCFRILCPTHGIGERTFEGSLRAVVYAREREIKGTTKIDMSIALDTFNSYHREEIVSYLLLIICCSSKGVNSSKMHIL